MMMRGIENLVLLPFFLQLSISVLISVLFSLVEFRSDRSPDIRSPNLGRDGDPRFHGSAENS